ncbi:MAG: cryptochrome/photolyase family protein, partial [Pseudomonadota bacterium]
MSSAQNSPLILVLGNQLFPPACLGEFSGAPVFMAEDVGLCTRDRHHQQKIVLFLAAMRCHAEELGKRGFDVNYHRLDEDGDIPFEDKLAASIGEAGADVLVHFEIEDKFMEQRIIALCEELGIERRELPSPMFLCSREYFADYVGRDRRLLMANFYKEQRKRLDIMVDADGNPDGGKWSFDEDNRKKLPASVDVPDIGSASSNAHVDDVIELVSTRFGDHPGDARQFWWPTTRRQALRWLDKFLTERLDLFGPYEDAMTTRTSTVFHSVLTPMLNLGLITPREIVDKTLAFAEDNDVRLASLEGFVRQVIGWREFIRGIYQNFSEKQDSTNFFGHERELSDHWFEASTGIVPLDDTIRTARDLGWTHHIPRLMVAANLMTLCEIRPTEAHRWFMEMYIDSSDWVMGPNVYGMGIFSDGGIFASKPYVCGSNYMLKMSDYKKGDWCDTVDGLYWRF